MRMRWWNASASVLSTALLLGPAAAAAQETTTHASAAAMTDVLVLTSGARYRCVVMEYEPGVRVVVEMPDGTQRAFTGPEVASVTFGGAPSAAPATSATTSAAPSEASTPSGASTPSTPSTPSVATAAVAPAPNVWSAPRDYALSIERPWTNHAARPARRPHGDLHFGMQLALAFDFAAGFAFYPEGQDWLAQPAGVVFLFADARVGNSGTFRIGALGLFGPGGTAADREYVEILRAWTVGVRVLGGHDLTPDLTLRVGGEIDFFEGNREFILAEALARAELSGRLLDSRALEVGGAISIGPTLAEQDTPWGSDWAFASALRAEVYAAWVFE